MILNFILLFIASAIIFSLLIPKPNIENAKAQEFGEDGFPQATENSPIPFLIGKTILKSPNTLFAGNFRAVPITERVRVGLFKKKTIIVGYNYYATIDLGFCIGDDADGVTLHEIHIDDEVVWTGTISGEGSGNINAANLFGGTKNGGGFASLFRFYPGTFDQSKNAYIDSLPGSLGLQTPYRGVCHLVFQDAYIGESPNLRAICIVASRFTNRLGLTEGRNIIGGETTNLMEAMYELMVNTYGGLAAPVNLFDLSAFQDAAIVMVDEGQGVGGVISSSTSGENVIKEFLKQADALLTIDPTTNLVKPLLLRKDYNVATLPELNENHITEVVRFTQTLWQELVSEVKVGIKDPDKDYQDVTAVAQDLAIANITGRLKTVSISLPFCKDLELANRIAGRELNQLSQIVTQVRFKVNRKAYTLSPGQVFKWSWADYGISNMILRVKDAVDGSDKDPIITIDAIRDTYDNTNNPFDPPSGGVTTPLVSQPQNVTEYSFFEAHQFLVTGIIDSPLLTNDFAYPVALPTKPNSSHVGYEFYVDSSTASDSTQIAFPLQGLLSAGIDRFDNQLDMVIPSITITGLDTALIADTLSNDGADAVRGGGQLVIINGEILGYETYTDNGGGSVTLNNVHRALLNTVQQTHPVNDVLYFFDYNYVSQIPTEVIDSPVDLQFITSTGVLSQVLDDVTVHTEAVVGAIESPDPPDWITLDGSRAQPADLDPGDTTTIAWRPRNKTINSIRLAGDTADALPVGMTFDVELYNITQATGPDWLLLDTTLTSTTLTIPVGYDSSDVVELRITAKQGGLESLHFEAHRFIISLTDNLALEGDQQSGTDALLLEGDQQSGGDRLDLEGDQV